jgi:uncharacterized protein (TIGR02265 family)
MARVKGTDVVQLREEMRERGAGVETPFLQRLSEEDRHAYLTMMPISWTSLDGITRIHQTAAELLFPEEPEPMRRLGQMIARRVYTGIHKLFLRIPSIQFVLSRTASIWRTYFDGGAASIERVGDHAANLVVRDFSDLTPGLRRFICGHISAIIEMAGGKEVRVVLDEKDPQAWRWQFTWK